MQLTLQDPSSLQVRFLPGEKQDILFLRIIKFAHASLCNVMMMPIDITGPKFFTGKFSAYTKTKTFFGQ